MIENENNGYEKNLCGDSSWVNPSKLRRPRKRNNRLICKT